jgi:hypothetical protein
MYIGCRYRGKKLETSHKGPTEAEIKKRLPVAGGAGRQALRIDD